MTVAKLLCEMRKTERLSLLEILVASYLCSVTVTTLWHTTFTSQIAPLVAAPLRINSRAPMQANANLVSLALNKLRAGSNASIVGKIL